MDTSPIITHGNLVPNVEESSNANHTVRHGGNKKRKRQNDEITNPFFRPFASILCPQTTSKSHTFVPIAHLPRADLPLIWLDHTLRKPLIQPGALLNLGLEHVHREALKEHASMLVARLAPNGGLYAVESAGDGLYIACGLRPWITESRVIGQSLGRNSDVNDVQCLLDQQKEITASKNVVLLKPRTPKKPKDRRGALARISILPAQEIDDTEEPHRIRGESEVPTTQLLSGESAAKEPLPHETIRASLNFPSPPQAKGFDLDQLRVQYLEALYLSKMPLAYFAKGPLTRARNHAQVEDDEIVRTKLLEFYRESVISTKKLDLKYKESINQVIESAASLKPVGESAEGQPKKTASRKKKKIGKDALYPAEGDYIQRCWAEREVRNGQPLSAASQAQDQRKLVTDLKTRETKMQILLILEILGLETLPEKGKDLASANEKNVKIENQDEEKSVDIVMSPAKLELKKKDYNSDLDTLIDRLCIWHIVGIDDMIESPEKKDQETQKSSLNKDQLRDFCADVIIPFYASRLPEQCKFICRKLGGPEVSPKRCKPALTKSASTSRLPPGAAIMQRQRAMPRKTLERVLSDDRSMRHAPPPTLSRSSTAPLGANLKRGASEPVHRPASRGALYKSVSFSNREVDLDADVRVQEAKRKKLARVMEQKKELNAAIAALKKPNRSVAAQGFMDEIESRTLDSKTRRQETQITATPKRLKPRTSKQHEPTLPPTLEFDPYTDDAVIPSSTVRPRSGLSVRPGFPPASAKKRAVLFAIHESPAQPSSSHEVTQGPVSRLKFPSMSQGVSISSDPTLVESTPATNRLRPDLPAPVENTPMRMNKSMRPVLFTPLKKTDVRVEDAFRDAPMIPADAGKAMDRVMGGGATTELSVYDALGWNDDYDL